MSSKPLVSTIVIFLNAEKFIQEALESVFAQTYDNWELLLVDDGSTDGSTKIALQCAGQNPSKVRYLEHEGHQNLGMSATRNKGICNAEGKYIAFLDADDVWLPHKLEQQVAILDSQPEVAMVYGPSQGWYSWTGKPEDVQRDFANKIGLQSNTPIEPPTLLTLSLKRKVITPCPSNVMLRRKVVKHIGGFEESFRGIYQLYEDQVFFAKVHLNAPVFVTDECWDRYRQHPDSCVSVVKKAGKADTVRLAFLNWLDEYLSEQGAKDTEVWQALQQALWPYRHPILYRLLQLSQQMVRQSKELVKLIAQRTLPLPFYRWLRVQWQGHNLAK